MSVGSVTITETRQEHLDFTQPYDFMPAQMAMTEGSGIESLEDFSGRMVCAAEGTTRFDRLEGKLKLKGGRGRSTDRPRTSPSTTLQLRSAEPGGGGRPERSSRAGSA